MSAKSNHHQDDKIGSYARDGETELEFTCHDERQNRADPGNEDSSQFV